MTKSGRKRKKADKAKVQLKKGKKSLRLPKGQNVTDSRVTTKKITLVTQLTGPSQKEDGPLTRKKISMKVGRGYDRLITPKYSYMILVLGPAYISQ